MFATWYTYGTDHAPMWLSALMKQDAANPKKFEATSPPWILTRTSGPRLDNYRSSDKMVNIVGTLTVIFYDGNRADFTYTTLTATGLPAVTQTKSITRLLFAPGATLCN
jgi:hypothetical protein